MKKTRGQTGILLEMFQPVANSEIVFLENTSINGINKTAFKVRLQTLEERNNNGRFYDRGIGKEIVEILKPKAIGRSLFMEVDHPMVAGNDDFARKRAVTVEMKNCGALIRDIRIENNEIIGEAETLSGFLGPDLYKTIKYDKIDIGFSLRMFGRTQLEEGTGLNRVVRPIRPITYDIVTNPSHSSARILEFVTEDISNFLVDSQNMNIIHESCLCQDGICLSDMNESVYDYLDSILNSTFKTIGPVRFRI